MKYLQHFPGKKICTKFLYQEVNRESVESVNEQLSNISSIEKTVLKIKLKVGDETIAREKKIAAINAILPMIEKTLNKYIPEVLEKNPDKTSELDPVLLSLEESKVYFLAFLEFPKEKKQEIAVIEQKEQKNPEKIIPKQVLAEDAKEENVSSIDMYKADDFLNNKYLMMLLYYSDVFTSKTLINLKGGNTQEMLKIKNEIGNLSEVRNKFIKKLSEKYEYSNYDFKTTKKPLDIINSPNGENHTDAIDLFIKEGSPVYSMTGGIVLIVESNWNSSDETSSVSNKGGNFVLIFNPETNEFFRYCHLQSTENINPGDVVSAGQNIGKVGHTGKNATRPGHGNHLHIEINTFNNGKMIPQQRKYLMNRVNKAL